jgi:hypothetical protein
MAAAETPAPDASPGAQDPRPSALPPAPAWAVVHQTWSSVDVTEPFAGYRARIRHPTRLWTDEEMREFVRSTYGADDGARYDAMPLDVHRWDAFRYFLLYALGGMYLDLDMEPERDFAPLLRDELVLCAEHPDDSRRMRRPVLVSNAMMVARPGHPFMLALLDELRQRPPRGTTRRAVVDDSGPGLVTRVRGSRPPEGLLLPHAAFFPVPLGGRSPRRGTFATHRFASTWWPQCEPPAAAR